MAGTYRSGARPVPTALHVLRGTLRSNRHVRDRAGEPHGEAGRPPLPLEIEHDPEARAHWERLAGHLERNHVLARQHGDALALLAQARADYDRVRAQLQAMNYQQLVVDEVRDKTGAIVRRRVRENPLLRRSERLALLVARLLGDFGLTPVTQTKVHATDAAQKPSRASRYISA